MLRELRLAQRLFFEAKEAGVSVPALVRQDPYGKGFEGVIPNLRRRYEQATWVDQADIERYRSLRPCDGCHGERLRPESRAVTIGDVGDEKGKSIVAVSRMTIEAAARVTAEAVLASDNTPQWVTARDQAVLTLLYGCGLRVGELVGLDLAARPAAHQQGRGWVDLQAGEAHVFGKGSKSIQTSDEMLQNVAQMKR